MIALSDGDISIEEVEKAVSNIDCGAGLLFVGRVRGVYKGQTVHHLEYEAYPQMAIRRMQEIAKEAMVIAKKKMSRQTRSTTNDTFFHSSSELLQESVSTKRFSNLSILWDSLKSMPSMEDCGYSGILVCA